MEAVPTPGQARRSFERYLVDVSQATWRAALRERFSLLERVACDRLVLQGRGGATMTFTIHASKDGHLMQTLRLKPQAAVSKARSLKNAGWEVHITNQHGDIPRRSLSLVEVGMADASVNVRPHDSSRL